MVKKWQKMVGKNVFKPLKIRENKLFDADSESNHL